MEGIRDPPTVDSFPDWSAARAAQGQSQVAETSSEFPMCMAGAQAFQASSAAFSGTYQGTESEMEQPRLKLSFQCGILVLQLMA